ncbi:hypothetical protein NLJ89_g3903 [Agrocybe chaxingu]|uniref:Uncharacterized protein n=1 Tax=Agrocybe chaxingu TaxID=84603 RepID=A0A9W8K3W1_9AGAR|nr:hypothetical protein NLJ89_g3903 [Agrocybe chaxingu]
MPYAVHDTHFIGQEHYDANCMDLCDLLQTMRLDPAYHQGKTAENSILAAPPPLDIQDELMTEDTTHQCDTASESSNSSSSPRHEELYGCAYLQAIQSQLTSDGYTTTGGEYLDAIFTHREILYAHPAAHQECARAFTDIAYVLEKRAWRADREADIEAVTAFRHEAWVIAATLAPAPSKPKETISNGSGNQSGCVFMPMM